MNRETFNVNFAVLVRAFLYSGQKLDPETQEIYWHDLKDIPNQQFEDGVAWCRHHSEFFPTIARLGAACYNGDMDWYERIVEKKRLELKHRMKKLAPPPMSEEKRQENLRKIASLADNLGKKMEVK